MKKLIPLLSPIVIILLIATSCSENSEQPNTPSANYSSSTLAKSTGTNAKLGVIGKIFTNEDAKTLFGKVLTSCTISANELNSALSKGGDYILMTIKNNQVVIRNEKKQHLSSEQVPLKKDETLYIYSKSMIQELLNAKTSSLSLAKGSDVVTAEFREGVFTLTYGDATLEMSALCPPVCFE